MDTLTILAAMGLGVMLSYLLYRSLGWLGIGLLLAVWPGLGWAQSYVWIEVTEKCGQNWSGATLGWYYEGALYMSAGSVSAAANESKVWWTPSSSQVPMPGTAVVSNSVTGAWASHTYSAWGQHYTFEVCGPNGFGGPATNIWYQYWVQCVTNTSPNIWKCRGWYTLGACPPTGQWQAMEEATLGPNESHCWQHFEQEGVFCPWITVDVYGPNGPTNSPALPVGVSEAPT